MKAILAMSENRAIGKNGALPWPSIKEDFKHFREFTMGKNLVVGHSTFMTLPPLKGRNIYFISRPKAKTPDDVPTGDYGYYTNSHGTVGKRLWYINDVISGIANVDMFGKESHWKLEDPIIAGGAKTYELFLPYITEFYVTHVKGVYDADTYMIPFEHLYNKQEVIKEFDGHRVVKYTK
jgi:dihydrofolate reductase